MYLFVASACSSAMVCRYVIIESAHRLIPDLPIALVRVSKRRRMIASDGEKQTQKQAITDSERMEAITVFDHF